MDRSERGVYRISCRASSSQCSICTAVARAVIRLQRPFPAAGGGCAPYAIYLIVALPPCAAGLLVAPQIQSIGEDRLCCGPAACAASTQGQVLAAGSFQHQAILLIMHLRKGIICAQNLGTDPRVNARSTPSRFGYQPDSLSRCCQTVHFSLRNGENASYLNRVEYRLSAKCGAGEEQQLLRRIGGLEVLGWISLSKAGGLRHADGLSQAVAVR